jgi:hypothetical protein
MTTTLSNVLTAGDTLDFTTAVPDYLASAGWTLKYRLAPRVSGAAIDITSAADGDDHRVTATAATTAAWAAGFYGWSAYVEKAAERYTVDTGELQIRAASATIAAGTDNRSHVRKMLDAVRALLEGKTDVVEYTINGRSMKKMSMAELRVLENQYSNAVASEDAAANLANGIRPGGKLYVRF